MTEIRLAARREGGKRTRLVPSRSSGWRVNCWALALCAGSRLHRQDRLQRLTAVKSADATPLQDLRYATTATGAVGYDAVGNLLRIEDWQAGSPQVHSYSYDDRDRLLSANVTGGIGGNYSEVDTYDPVTGTLSSKAGVAYGYRDPAHRQAVTHRGSTLSYSYDANGNQTWRRVWGTSGSLTYDEENHLTAVSGGATASFAYDGDGRLVKATVNGTTTVYIGNYYEYQVGSGTTRKYYSAGGQRVAMRESGILSWLLSDHLGSTTIAANAAGTERGERRYQAWGWTRYSSGTVPTNFRFTGQRQLVLGLYYYGARWYDTITGRFIQPDAIVPEPGNPLAYDRYAYARNNPVKFVDPTGYDGCAASDRACWKQEWYWKNRWYNAHGFFVPAGGGHWRQQGTAVFADEAILGDVLGEAGLDPVGRWSFEQLRPVGEGAVDLANAIGKGLGWLKTLLGGGARVLHGDRTPRICFGAAACAPPPIFGTGEKGHNIYFSNALLAGDPSWARATVVHELAHVIDWNSSFTTRTPFRLSDVSFSLALPLGDPKQPITLYSRKNLAESWAEAVTVWVYGDKYPTYLSALTTQQSDFITRFLSGWGW